MGANTEPDLQVTGACRVQITWLMDYQVLERAEFSHRNQISESAGLTHAATF